MEDYETIVYNQIITIPLPSTTKRELDKKKKKHRRKEQPTILRVMPSLQKKFKPYFIISLLMDNSFVNAHFSILFSTNTLEEMEGTQSLIENKLFTKGIIVSKMPHNQLELFRAAIPEMQRN